MTEHMSSEQYKAYLSKPKGSKFGNVKTEVDGHLFDSKAEANRYVELKMLQAAGEIKGFMIQPSYVIGEGIRYRPDFMVCDMNDKVWVEDVKGMETKEFKIKQKLWDTKYPWLELRIVR